MKLQSIDPTTLMDLRHHPRNKDAQAALAEAKRLLTETERRVAQVKADLIAAEHAAATGKRDDRRLKAVHEAVVQSESDLRIANARVQAANETLTSTLQATCVEVEHELIERHMDATQRLDDALKVAQRCSHEVAMLESVSHRLFPGGPYRQHEGLPGRPLREMAWWKEFGGPNTTSETRYSYWHQYIERYLKTGA